MLEEGIPRIFLSSNRARSAFGAGKTANGGILRPRYSLVQKCLGQSGQESSTNTMEGTDRRETKFWGCLAFRSGGRPSNLTCPHPRQLTCPCSDWRRTSPESLSSNRARFPFGQEKQETRESFVHGIPWFKSAWASPVRNRARARWRKGQTRRETKFLGCLALFIECGPQI